MTSIGQRVSALLSRRDVVYRQDFQPDRLPQVATGPDLDYLEEDPSTLTPFQSICVLLGVIIFFAVLVDR